MKAHSEDRQLITKLFFKLLPIQILLAAIGAVNGLVSSLFAANAGLDGEVMSAIGLYGPVGFIVGAVNIVFLTGATILCGEHMGRNELDKTQNLFTWDLWITGLIGAGFTALLLLGGMTGFGAAIFTSDPKLQEHLNPYIIGQAIGVAPLILGAHIASFLSLENQSKRTTLASLVCIAVNVLLNFLFLSTGWIRNAFSLALAGSLGQWVFLGVQMLYYFSGKSTLKLHQKRHKGTRILDLVKIGYPGALATGYQAIRGIIVNTLILNCAAAGSAGLSAFAASSSVLTVFWAVPGGILAVSRMMLSISIGEEDRHSLVTSMKVSLSWGILILLCIDLLLCAFSVPLTTLFYHEGDAPYRMTVDAFRILPFCMPLSLICTHFVLYGQTSGKPGLVHTLSILDGVVCVAGFTALLMLLNIGMNSVYYANILNGVVCALVVVAYSWIVRKTPPKNMEELMVVPDDFGFTEDARIDISVRSMEEVLTVSEQVIAFCRNRGIDEARAYRAGLFLEEMAGNVVDHGFHKDKKNHSVDIRVVYKDDDVILRIKDDCVPFDPAEHAALMNPEDQVRNLGIRVVYKAAKKIDYQNMLGLNVLTIRI